MLTNLLLDPNVNFRTILQIVGQGQVGLNDNEGGRGQ